MQDLRQGNYMVHELGIRPTRDMITPDRESDRRSIYMFRSLERERGLFISRPTLIVSAMSFRPHYSKVAPKCTHHYRYDVCICNLYRCVFVTQNIYAH